MLRFLQTPTLPKCPRQIAIIGAGSIVRDAHLPAYRQAGFPVAAIFNRTRATAEKLAVEWNIPRVCASLNELIETAPAGAVFDLTLPADKFVEVLARLPVGVPVLIQKPMGESLDEARRILAICRERRLVAAINFQLRFAPFVLAAKSLIDQGAIGELRDMEIRVTVETPWDHFPFLKNVPRLEIVYHSIHHLDCVRYFLGDPIGVYAKSQRFPELGMPESRSAFILDYGERVRANIQTNHFHRYGARHQESYIKWEGTRGAIKAQMGLLMNYPKGVGDYLEICQLGDGAEPRWRPLEIRGSWFPEAFVGAMAQVMRAADGEPDALVTSVEDAVRTMALVEAAYASSAQGGVLPAYEP